MEDREIVDLYWARNETALTETGTKYGLLLRKLALGILCSEQDCEEVLNDTYLAAWNSMPDNRPHNLGAYLCRIVRNLALNKRRWRTAEKRNAEYDVCLDELTAFFPSSSSVEDDFDARETARMISSFLYTQDATNRQIFLRRYWFFDTPEEIAEMFGMKPNTVKSILYRTKTKLLRYLREEGRQV